MPLDPFHLPVPCRSGRFCENCRDSVAGIAFRASNLAVYPQMFGPDESCNFGLPWEFKGRPEWADAFIKRVREQSLNAATDIAAAQPTLGPGDAVKIILARLGYQPHPNCGCEEFRVQMNAWGWWGSLRRRKEITAWFASKAREQKIEIEDDNLWSLIRAGLKDLLSRRRKNEKRET